MIKTIMNNAVHKHLLLVLIFIVFQSPGSILASDGGTFGSSPDQPAIVQPSDGATDVPIPSTLEVAVSDPDDDTLDVSFYGRPVVPFTGEDFTIIALPDTQNESQYYPAAFNAQTQWIANNKVAENIVFTTHLGDIVNNANSSTEYSNADTAMDFLDAGNVAYSVGPGNHDMGAGSLYETFFGVSRFSTKSWYGGHFGSDNYNNYSLFSASGMDFLVINLQYNPTSAMLDWADALLKAYPERRGIVESHNILNVNNSWSNQTIYTALKDNPNLFLLLCGHMHTPTDGAGQRVEIGDFGNTIYVLLSDYQDYPNGGNGYLRKMRFSPADDRIYVRTYSPYVPGFLTDAQNQFELPYDMAGTAPFELIGTVTGVPSGFNVSITWYTDPETEYEWYVTVSDDNQSTIGRIWGFTTTDQWNNVYIPIVIK